MSKTGVGEKFLRVAVGGSQIRAIILMLMHWRPLLLTCYSIVLRNVCDLQSGRLYIRLVHTSGRSPM